MAINFIPAYTNKRLIPRDFDRSPTSSVKEDLVASFLFPICRRGYCIAPIAINFILAYTKRLIPRNFDRSPTSSVKEDLVASFLFPI